MLRWIAWIIFEDKKVNKGEVGRGKTRGNEATYSPSGTPARGISRHKSTCSHLIQDVLASYSLH